MPGLKIHTLTDGQLVTSQQIARKAGITRAAANWRLRQSKDPEFVFAPAGKNYGASLDAKLFTLDDGTTGTARQLAEQAGIRINTMRQRLKLSTDAEYVMRDEAFDRLNGKIYIMPDGSEITVKEMAIDRQCSDTAAYDFLEGLGLAFRWYRKVYELDNGLKVTIDEVMTRTGVSHSGAKKRLAKSRQASEVLKPHHARDKQIRQITRYIPGENGLEKEVIYKRGAV